MAQNLNISSKCPENWEGMDPCGENKHCLSCNKIVYDFTQKSDEEIIRFLNANKDQKICGRLTAAQIKQVSPKRPSMIWRTMSFLLPTVFVMGMNDAKPEDVSTPSYDVEIMQNDSVADTVVVHGTVVDADSLRPLPYAAILLKGTDMGATTNEAGEFELRVSRHVLSTHDTLVCSYIGFETQEIKLSVDSTQNEFQMRVNMNMPIYFIGSVVYKKPPLHKRIFKKHD